MILREVGLVYQIGHSILRGRRYCQIVKNMAILGSNDSGRMDVLATGFRRCASGIVIEATINKQYHSPLPKLQYQFCMAPCRLAEHS